MKQISPQALRAMISDGDELGLFDMREEGVFAHRHLLFACCLPLSHLEQKIGALAPRKSARIVLVDAGPGVNRGESLAARAGARLEDMGYSDLAVLEGGIEAWGQAGFELFSGVNVPSKAFGELVEHDDGTPHISAEELKALLDNGDAPLILDSRPYREYHRMNIPGGIDTPGAELVYRFGDLAPDPERLVVVNCAGRTRSIIGAQSLINAGVPNRVVALKDGTMGWELAGFELDHGSEQSAPAPSPPALAGAKVRAAQVAKRFGVQTITRDSLDAWRGEAGERSLFVLDVRSPEEFEAGHLPGSRSAPGGQLVQATDEYVGVRNARIVLVDNDGVRATMTASWLIQLGWEDVAVLEGGLAGGTLETGPEQLADAGHVPARANFISPAELRIALRGGTCALVDFATSLEYRAAHIPDAWFAVRARLPEDAEALPDAAFLVATSPDGGFAELAAGDLADATGKEVKVLEGGTQAWLAAGFDLTDGFENMASQNDDVWYKPYDHDGEVVAEHMREYLTWEVGLVEQIARDGTARFRRFD